MIAVDADSVTVASAFLLGAVLGTIATLRVVRFVTDYFSGVERRRRGGSARGTRRP